jgi:4-diphosphocytidyl-2C-methyl-D-erythritol kinase
MSLTGEQVKSILASVNASLEVLYRTINKYHNDSLLQIRDLEQEIDIVRNELQKLRQELKVRGVL